MESRIEFSQPSDRVDLTSGNVTIDELKADIPRYIANILNEISVLDSGTSSLPSPGTQLTEEDISKVGTFPSLTLPPGPDDVPAYHDFYDLQLESLKSETNSTTRAEADIVQKAMEKTNFNASAQGSFTIGVWSGGGSSSLSQDTDNQSAEAKAMTPKHRKRLAFARRHHKMHINAKFKNYVIWRGNSHRRTPV